MAAVEQSTGEDEAWNDVLGLGRFHASDDDDEPAFEVVTHVVTQLCILCITVLTWSLSFVSLCVNRGLCASWGLLLMVNISSRFKTTVRQQQQLLRTIQQLLNAWRRMVQQQQLKIWRRTVQQQLNAWKRTVQRQQQLKACTQTAAVLMNNPQSHH